MRQGYITVIVFFLLAGSIFPQTIFEAYHKVERKLSSDKKYLNVYAVNFQPKSEDIAALSNIPRAESGGKFTFRVKDNVTYQFIILKENYELDSTVILTVKEIEDKAASGESFFGETTGAKIDTTIVLSFGDIQDLYFSGNPFYSVLYDAMMEHLKIEDPASMLGITGTEKLNKSRGITTLDNTDFLNFQKANSIHHYPKTVADKKSVARRRGAVDAASSESEYQIDADFSHLSFFHKSMDFGFTSVSAEVNTEAKALNIVPYKPMALTLGVRMFMNTTSTGAPDPKNDFILDAKILGRVRMNLSNTVSNIPFLSGEKPLLNVGSGLILDVTGSRAYGLPAFNVYFASGENNVSHPYSSIGPLDSSTAFFTFRQWETSFSFFWNSSEERLLRMRMDIGAGCYDVVKSVYYQGTASKELVYNKIKPSIALYLNFAPQNVDFMGTSLRFYDNVLTASLWMKIVEFSPISSLRFEASYITSPIFRSQYPWEAEGGNSIVQLRYRYGLN